MPRPGSSVSFKIKLTGDLRVSVIASSSSFFGFSVSQDTVERRCSRIIVSCDIDNCKAI